MLQPNPRPPLLEGVLKIGGALIAVEVLVSSLVFLDPRLLHISRADGNEI